MKLKGRRFPSLLFTGEPRRGDIAPEVFRDLKLNNLLDSETNGVNVTGVMSGLCPREDIAKRRELFDELREMRRDAGGDFLKDPFGELGFALWETAGYDAAMRSRGGSVRALIFAYLCRPYCDFCRKAAEFESNGFFLSRMAKYFAGFREKEGYAEFEAETGRLAGLLPEGSIGAVWRAGEGLSEGISEKEGFLSRICEKINYLYDEDDELTAAADGSDLVYERVSDSFAEKLARLYPEYVKEAERFYGKYADFYDAGILEYDGEFDFINGLLRLEETLAERGVPLCSPEFTDKGGVEAKDAYDLTLIEKDEKNIVPNDVFLTGKEPFFFLSGANGGGKTTYLRTVGVNVLLALSGAKAAARSMTVGGIDGVFTHFPQDEDYIGEGRFDAEKRRAEDILEGRAKNPLVLLNETFSTTDETKSRREIERYAEKLLRRGAYGVYVTHTAGVGVPGVGKLVCETDGGARTYRVIRAESTEGPRAADLIEKHGLTPDALRKLFAIKEGDDK